jgi:cytochrome o ubiquinol oxidase subunit 1
MPDRSAVWNFLLGRLSLAALPLDNTIVVYTFFVVAAVGACILGAITVKRKWGYLWREWFTTVDHKKLGIMYMILAR